MLGYVVHGVILLFECVKRTQNVLNFRGAYRGRQGQFFDPQVAPGGLSHSDKQVMARVLSPLLLTKRELIWSQCMIVSVRLHRKLRV
jgi:hypothetical protein